MSNEWLGACSQQVEPPVQLLAPGAPTIRFRRRSAPRPQTRVVLRNCQLELAHKVVRIVVKIHQIAEWFNFRQSRGDNGDAQAEILVQLERIGGERQRHLEKWNNRYVEIGRPAGQLRIGDLAYQ